MAIFSFLRRVKKKATIPFFQNVAAQYPRPRAVENFEFVKFHADRAIRRRIQVDGRIPEDLKIYANFKKMFRSKTNVTGKSGWWLDGSWWRGLTPDFIDLWRGIKSGWGYWGTARHLHWCFLKTKKVFNDSGTCNSSTQTFFGLMIYPKFLG